MQPPQALRARAGAVSAELRAHKKAIREHRTAAQAAAAELARIEAECARRGIAFSLIGERPQACAPESVPGRTPPAGRA
ncbi:MAG: hypothetical protein HEQ22_03420 [Sphingopyxis sp.]|uniref:hypothetical protein n=1 Tax=Sphingopyxis sp. TaxID=1908224 RepID=UPI003D80E84A